MITLEQAKKLRPGDMIHHVTHKNTDGTPQRWKVNGQPRIWKRRPDCVTVPIKHGLRDYECLTEVELDGVSMGDGL